MKPRNWSNDMITPVGRIPWNVQDREKRTIIFRLENRISSSCSLPFVYIFVISRYFNFSRSSGRGIKRKLGRGLQQQQQGWRIYANRSIILIPVALLHIQDSRCVQEKKQNNWLLAPNKESNKNQFFFFSTEILYANKRVGRCRLFVISFSRDLYIHIPSKT
jgi:hypothetical protein